MALIHGHIQLPVHQETEEELTGGCMGVEWLQEPGLSASLPTVVPDLGDWQCDKEAPAPGPP